LKNGSLLDIIKDTERDDETVAFDIVSNISQIRMTAVNIRGM
jgi:hypothetical protein